jgi:hypothetical protein
VHNELVRLAPLGCRRGPAVLRALATFSLLIHRITTPFYRDRLQTRAAEKRLAAELHSSQERHRLLKMKGKSDRLSGEEIEAAAAAAKISLERFVDFVTKGMLTEGNSVSATLVFAQGRKNLFGAVQAGGRIL